MMTLNASGLELVKGVSRDNQRHATLQAYLDKMSELLLNGNLAERTADG